MPFSNLRLGLFAKLMLAFLVVIVGGSLLATGLTRRAMVGEFTIYTTANQQQQAEALAPLLSSYYASQGSWVGVDALLTSSANTMMDDGMMWERSDNMMGGMMMDDRMQEQSEMGWWSGMWSMTGDRVLLVDVNGRIVADSAAELTGQQISTDMLQRNGTPIIVNNQQVAAVLVTAGVQSEEQNSHFLEHVNQAILLSVLAASGMALLFGGLIAWRMVRPLRQLTVAAQNMAANNLEQHVNIPPGDEIGDLAIAFNQMAKRLVEAETLRRQMTADIAHELRTPLTVIQGNVEALQDGIFPLTLEALDPILDKTQLLGRLVGDLRQLSLADANQLLLDRHPTDIGKLVAQTIESFQSVAVERSIIINLDNQMELPLLNIDRQRIQQVLINLLSNALRHTPNGGLITVTLMDEIDRVHVSVQDSGTGIPASALPYVFERFYRVDQGRARIANSTGSGLGLAVARAIVEAHNGEIDVQSTVNQGTTFWFTLPNKKGYSISSN
ncbi:MAG: HAMP domain-containing histidine kinase, partial [Anaerolineae bacterium]|nr:HAMP domain-containing histidine kinase [Anaerolineae bacterium]